MLSILIPVYNYDISCLIQTVHKQATELDIEFEIICFNDNSEKFTTENKSIIEALSNSRYIDSEVNIGRVHARHKLCDESSYEWLLFLDADVLPKSDAFIGNYINSLSSGYVAFFGGFAYPREQPKTENILRWKYGKKFEEVDAIKRNLSPYQVIISANFLIKKSIFNAINLKVEIKGYGLDNYFASLLKQNNIKVLHINNEVYHFGLENNERYLKKVKGAIITLLWAFNSGKMPIHNNKLLSIFVIFRRFKLHYLMRFLFPFFSPLITRNLTGNNPNMLLLQGYKLLYICYKDLNQNNYD